jgi:transcription elongation factor SPT5
LCFNIYSPSSVGVVIKVERDQYKILDQSSSLITVKAQGIIQKRDSRNAVALDSQQNTIQANDVVEILEGEHKVCTFKIYLQSG